MPGKFTPYEKEMMISGHPDLSTVEVAAKYGATRQYVYQLRTGRRGVKGFRSTGKVRAERTASEHKFYAWACGEATQLLRDIIATEQHLRKSGIFHSEEVKAARDNRMERKWRHAEGPVRPQAQQVPEAGGAVHAGEQAYVPQARARGNGQNGEGFLFDSRRMG